MSTDDGQEGAEKAPIQQSLLKFLERFGQVRLTPFKTDPVLWDLGRRVQADLAALPCVKARPDIYTVGFDVAADQDAQDIVRECATDAQHVYLPSTGAALKTAFRAIGEDISRLRISR